MTDTYLWSPSKLGFYPSSLLDIYKAAGTLPSDAVEVEDTCYQQYGATPPPEGKTRGVGADNLPAWVDIGATSTTNAAE